MPWLQTLYDRFQDYGLNIIGLTEVNRSASDASVRKFIEDNGITYPIFKENGRSRDYFKMPGTPFMILIHDGMLVWEHFLPIERFPTEIVARVVEPSG